MGPISIIILAAGKGTRMKSSLPKVLHPVAGRPMIERVIREAQRLNPEEIRVVVSPGTALVVDAVQGLGAAVYYQRDQKGTADAVRSAQPENMEANILIINSDHPLIRYEDLKEIQEAFIEHELDLAVVTCELEAPGSYGRIIRQQGQVKAIVEAKDAGPEALKIKEVNTGIYMVSAQVLKDLLPQIKNNNAQNEFYLTDLVTLALDAGLSVDGIKTKPHMAQGVNTQKELAMASKAVFKRKAEKLMEDGVTILDPDNTYIEESVEVGAGSVIYPNTFLRGKTMVGTHCVIEPGVWIENSLIENEVRVLFGSHIEGAKIAKNANIGPYARLRPGTEIAEECKVGNFVEMKKVKFGKGSKASHLTYLGDATVGENVNVGCGVITCNFAADGKKYHTDIGNNVFVGSDSQLVAPVKVGDGSVIASGSTITKDVPSKALAFGRARQEIKENYTPKKPKA